MSVLNKCLCGKEGCEGPHMCKCGSDCGCEKEKENSWDNEENPWSDSGIENFSTYR